MTPEPRRSAVLTAVLSSDFDALKAAIAGGGDVNEGGPGGWTPLGYAITRGDIKSVELLLDAGADIELAVEPGDPLMTPLWFAEEFWGMLEIGVLLRSRGASEWAPSSPEPPATAGSRLLPGVRLSPEPRDLPRWAQILAGLMVAALALPCLAGSLVMALLPNEKAPVSAPICGFVMTLMSLWLFTIACRLFFGRRASGGLLTPFMLRAVAWVFLLLPVGGLFTGWFASHPLVAVMQTLAYVSIFFGLRSLADGRDARAKATNEPVPPGAT